MVCPHLFLGGGWEDPVHDRDVDSCFLEDSPRGEDTRRSFTAFRSDPRVADKIRWGGGGGGGGGRGRRGEGLDGLEGEDDVLLEGLHPVGHSDPHRVLRRLLSYSQHPPLKSMVS